MLHKTDETDFDAGTSEIRKNSIGGTLELAREHAGQLIRDLDHLMILSVHERSG